MGYTTDFTGKINIDPPLNKEEIDYLNRFASSRRMKRGNGPYYANPGSDGFGQDHEPDIRDYNGPPDGQPGLWCQWRPNKAGTAIQWGGGEKFYHSEQWMKYLIEHFLAPGAAAKEELPFLQANHVLNGVIDAQGEDSDDRWKLIVKNNKVLVAQADVVTRYGTEQEV